MEHPAAGDPLAALRPFEQVMEYLYRSGVDLDSEEEVAAHLEQYKQQYGLNELPPVSLHFIRTRKYRESDSRVFFSGGKRLGVFLHPRFVRFDVHSHSHLEFKYLVCGRAALMVDGQHLDMVRGDLCLIAPGVEHMVSIYDESTALVNIILPLFSVPAALPRVCGFENPFSNFFSGIHGGNYPAPILLCRTGEDPELTALIARAEELEWSAAGNHIDFIRSESAVEQFLLEILARHSDCFERSAADALPGNLLSILRCIMDSSPTLTLPKLAQQFNYSEAHLSRLIKKHTGRTFSELVKSSRMKRAADLLQNTSLSIQDVMLQTGYTGKSHFYRAFQEAHGCSPAQFRRNPPPPVPDFLKK